jgi:hypothetical protein
VTLEQLLRTAAVVAAVVVLAAPYQDLIVAKARAAAGWIQSHAGGISRVVAALLIVAAAWGKFPTPTFMVDLPRAGVAVPEPSIALRALVGPVRQALEGATPQARAAWSDVWSKAAKVVEAETAEKDQIFKDVPSLRILTVTALDIGWRRLSGVAPGSLPGLKAGVEEALASAVGKDARPLTDEMRASYVDVAMALAWAGQR